MALQSMTGFGRAERTTGGPGRPDSVLISIEAKSVNHRFLDISCKLPPLYQRAEPELQKIVRAALRRGRVDLFVQRTESVQNGSAPNQNLPTLNEPLFRAALDCLQQGFRIAGIQNEVLTQLEAARQAFAVRGVLESGHRDPDPAVEIPLLLEAATAAVEALSGMRSVEGRSLQRELEDQLGKLEQQVDLLTKLSAEMPGHFQDRLKERIGRLLTGTECDPQRLAQEVALLVDRADVAEELTRLRSHISQFKKAAVENEGGKKLEFLLQEMGREVNTTGAKSQSVEMGQSVVESKLILERLREQVLNVE